MRQENDIYDVHRENGGNQVGDLVSKTFEELGKNSRKQKRIAYIQYTWEQVAPAKVLDHTDNVFLFSKDGKRCFVVYVDDPVCRTHGTEGPFQVVHGTGPARGSYRRDQVPDLFSSIS